MLEVKQALSGLPVSRVARPARPGRHGFAVAQRGVRPQPADKAERLVLVNDFIQYQSSLAV